MRQLCFELSLADAPVSVSPCTNSEFAALLIAVVTKIRSFQMIGLEWPRPGMAVFHKMLVDFSASQVVGGLLPSPTPVPFCPRKAGQFCACATEPNARNSARTSDIFMTLLLLFLDVVFRELDKLSLIAQPDAIGFF